jgi:hypothetical protein
MGEIMSGRSLLQSGSSLGAVALGGSCRPFHNNSDWPEPALVLLMGNMVYRNSGRAIQCKT